MRVCFHRGVLIALALGLFSSGLRGQQGEKPSVIAVTLAVSPTLAGQRATAAPQGWRASWDAFAGDLEKFRKTAKDFPSPSFQMLSVGQEVPDTFSVKRQFAGAVSWSGSFVGVLTKDSKDTSLMEGHQYKLDIKVPAHDGGSGFILHVYPKVESIDAWKKLTAGSTVRFTADLKGVAGFQPLAEMKAKDTVVYYVLLLNAQPVVK